MFGKLIYNFRKINDKLVKNYEKSLFKNFGIDSYFGKNCTFTYNTISIGNHVYIGSYCVIQSKHGYINIGNHVMFGPGVNIHGGNHETNKCGVFMDEVEKDFGCDPTIIIEDDVWIGANAIILKGVIIGKGSVIGAGSVVTKSIEPYSIVVGNPVKVIGKRFTEQEIQLHESLLYREHKGIENNEDKDK